MFRNFMRGRFGLDLISILAMIIALLLTRFNYLWILGVVLLGYAIFRIMSKDLDKRNREKQKFEGYIRTLVVRFRNYILGLKQRKTHAIIRCKQCKNTLRLPKNKGRIRVKCPVCGLEFFMKT